MTPEELQRWFDETFPDGVNVTHALPDEDVEDVEAIQFLCARPVVSLDPEPGGVLVMFPALGDRTVATVIPGDPQPVEDGFLLDIMGGSHMLLTRHLTDESKQDLKEDRESRPEAFEAP